MPLVSAKELLRTAREKGYCVAGFDVFNLELLEAVIHGCERMRSPVMIQTSFMNFDFYDRSFFCSAVKSVTALASIPVAFHLDHGAREMTIEYVLESIRFGFPSVMADYSHLPLQDNISMVRRAVEEAKRYDAAVEGELGQVSRRVSSGGLDKEMVMTDPGEAEEFVRRTGIDSLAVSVGSVTGSFDSSVIELDLPRLEHISNQVPIPLVFHGGTGIPDDQMRRAIQLGVAKVNVAHGLRKAFVDSLRSELQDGAGYTDPRPLLKNAMDAVQRYVESKVQMLGSAGTA